MSNDDKTVKLLKEAGLTGYQAKILSVLLRDSNLTAQEISDKSDIPYTKIYSVLNSLGEQGYVESNLERPKKYKSIPPEVLFEKIISNKERELEKLEDKLESQKDYLKKYSSENEVQEASLWLCPSRESMLNDTLSTFLSAQEEIIFVAYDVWRDFGTSKDFLDAFEDLKDRGVKMRMVVPSEGAEKDGEELEKLKRTGFKIKKIDKERILYSLMIVDGEKCGLPIKDDINVKSDRGLRINNGLIADTLSIYFESLWKEAEEL